MRVALKRVEDQVIVITGATSGIGLSTARLAADRRASLVLAARSRGALGELCRELRGVGASVIAVPADVSIEADVRTIAREACGAFGGFDTWVNNAGVSAYARCLDLPMDDARRIMDVNFWGTVYGSRAACEVLCRRGGALINVGSVVSDRGVPLQGAYSASKHAIKGWTDALRAELRAANAPVAVTLIKPAAIATPYAEHAKNYLHDQPTHRAPVYSPRSVAGAILFAAEHPTREIVVGGAGQLLEMADVIVPSLVDLVMARVVMPGMHSGRPSHGVPALEAPTEDLRERGEYRGPVLPSLYTAVRTHPFARGLGAATAALALGLLWRRRAARGSPIGGRPRAAAIGEMT